MVYSQQFLWNRWSVKFFKFIDEFIEKLIRIYSDIALLRNQNYFKIYDFDEGRVVEPDFLMFLNKNNREISIYQIFIGAKGNQFKDSNGLFENSKEGWKEKFLLAIEQKSEIDNTIYSYIDGKYKILGLPFFNEDLKKEFEEALVKKFLT